jgi:hypothetical protein
VSYSLNLFPSVKKADTSCGVAAVFHRLHADATHHLAVTEQPRLPSTTDKENHMTRNTTPCTDHTTFDPDCLDCYRVSRALDLTTDARARAEKREIEDERNFRGFVHDARTLLRASKKH